ncbi:MAG: ribonuclease H-like domain-containing protein [Candidatus Woesearchaeota archaeon]
MIRESFIFLDKIGKRAEQNIWKQGISCWNDFLDKESIKGISKKRKELFDLQLLEARRKLLQDDSEYFARLFPKTEHWRLYEHFRDEALFLDIEGNISVIGLYDGYETKTLVRGFNFDKRLLESIVSNYKILITFNGSGFDLPLLKGYFNFIPHIDLRFVCKKIGLEGGLEIIERKLKVKRAEDTFKDDIDIAFLWRRWWMTGERKYIDLLVKYNEEDIINLKQIADFVIKELWKKTRACTQEQEVLLQTPSLT